MDIDDDFILDVSDSDDIVLKVGGHHSDSTHAPSAPSAHSAPSAPSVPMPEATTSMLAEMATTEYSSKSLWSTTGFTPARGHSSTSPVSGRVNRTEMCPGRPRQDGAGNEGTREDAIV